MNLKLKKLVTIDFFFVKFCCLVNNRVISHFLRNNSIFSMLKKLPVDIRVVHRLPKNIVFTDRLKEIHDVNEIDWKNARTFFNISSFDPKKN